MEPALIQEEKKDSFFSKEKMEQLEELSQMTPDQTKASHWIEENQKHLKKYHQKWIVLLRDQILGEDEDADLAWEKALQNFQGDSKDLYCFYFQDFEQYGTLIL